MYSASHTVWNLYEQISIAALDTGDTNIANECIALLMKKFPDSARVGRLLGMQLEQAGQYEGALEVYSELLKKNPANLMIMKRKVSTCCRFVPALYGCIYLRRFVSVSNCISSIRL